MSHFTDIRSRLSTRCVLDLPTRNQNLNRGACHAITTRAEALVNPAAVLTRVGVALAFFACTGCATSLPPTGYPVCSIRPGTYACQIEQYEKVNE